MAYSNYSASNFQHKKNYSNHNNERIDQRNNTDMQYHRFRNEQRDIGAMMDLERSFTEYNIGDNENTNQNNNENYNVDYEDTEFIGLPFRSQSSSKRNNLNNRGDFDLLDYKNKSNKVKSFEDSGNYADIDESLGLITNSINSFDQVINDTSRITSWLFDIIYSKSSDPNIIINGMGLVNLSAFLYFVSRGKTETIISDFFGFNDRKELNAGLLTIRDKIISCREQISFDNYLISDSEYPINTKMTNALKKFVFTIILNKSDIHNELKRTNHMIKSLSNLNYNDLISRKTLMNIKIGIYSVMKIEPIWNIPLKNVTKGIFQPDYSNDQYEMDFLDFDSCEIKGYDDSEISMIEIPMMSKKGQSPFSIGICKSKTNKMISSFLDFSRLSSCVKYLKKMYFEKVIIPKLQTDTKIRLNKTLYKNNLNNIYENPNLDGLYPKGVGINDIVQYSIINFTSSSIKNKKKQTYHSSKRFICNQSFIYYLRNEELNLIMMIGKF